MPGTPFTFTNTSVGGFSAVWDFGDGRPSSLYNTSHIYGSGGTYTVTLTVTSPNGCTDVSLRKRADPANAEPLRLLPQRVAQGSPTHHVQWVQRA